MKLDRYIIELLSNFERCDAGGILQSYDLIPQLLRGEIKEITWAPSLTLDEHGQLSSIASKIGIKYYVKQITT